MKIADILLLQSAERDTRYRQDGPVLALLPETAETQTFVTMGVRSGRGMCLQNVTCNESQESLPLTTIGYVPVSVALDVNNGLIRCSDARLLRRYRRSHAYYSVVPKTLDSNRNNHGGRPPPNTPLRPLSLSRSSARRGGRHG